MDYGVANGGWGGMDAYLLPSRPLESNGVRLGFKRVLMLVMTTMTTRLSGLSGLESN
jgi:hypothetical protein